MRRNTLSIIPISAFDGNISPSGGLIIFNQPFFLLRIPVKFAILTRNASRKGRSMRILGIDPGFATIGFGLVEAERGQADNSEWNLRRRKH